MPRGLPGKTLFHAFFALVGNHRQHARDGESGIRSLVGWVIPTLPARIDQDGLALHLAERDGLRGQRRGRRDDDGVSHQFRVGNRPFERLLPADGAAGHHRQLAHAQVIDQPVAAPAPYPGW